MQVLIIIGSPRKGHSYRLTQQIERRLAHNADLRFEYVFLSQVNLQPCRGCYVCQSRGEQYCPIKDERGDLVKKMQQADGVIFVSPVYTGNVSGLMKNFMDRIAYTRAPACLSRQACHAGGDRQQFYRGYAEGPRLVWLYRVRDRLQAGSAGMAFASS